MKQLALALLALGSIACQSTKPAVVPAEGQARQALMEAVSALSGTWEGQAPDGSVQRTDFAVIAAGSVVRERMFPGEEHEMENLYALDGDSLWMTHYCAGGNQPRMRAHGITDGRIEFLPEGVSDLNAADEVYMGAMTLVLLDDDHIEQHWTAMTNGEPGDVMVFDLRRVE